MHRHLTVLRRANLSSGVVIQESERGRPWADSMVVVQDCAQQILKELEPAQVLPSKQSASLMSFRDYLSIHGTRLAFDLDYLTELVEASERVLGALPLHAHASIDVQRIQHDGRRQTHVGVGPASSDAAWPESRGMRSRYTTSPL
jgi:hypothetical protein